MVNCKRINEDTKELSSWTKSTYVTKARALFGAAVEWNYIDRNPFVPPKSSRRSSLKTQPKAKTWDHIVPTQFLSLIGATPAPRVRARYWLMYGSGLRPGEVYNLRVDKIDLEARTVRIENRDATDEVPGFTVKCDGDSRDGKARTVPIPVSAIPDLAVAMKDSFKAGGFVALTPERFQAVQRNWKLCCAGKPHGRKKKWQPCENRDMANDVLRNAKVHLKRAKIKTTSAFTLTTLRKSFAQNHADAGTPPKTLAELMGHSDVRMTMTYYARMTHANMDRAARTSDRLFRTGTDE